VFAGFSSPNFTQVPDELFDQLLPDLSGAETKVLLYIIRRTFGFKKDSDDISLSQLVDGITTLDGRQLDRGTGLSKSTVSLALKSLVAEGILIANRNRSKEKGDQATTYSLHFKVDPVSENRTGGVPKIEQARVRKSDTQETVIQEVVEQERQELWAQCLEHLSSQMTKANFDTWLADTKLISLNSVRAIITAPSAYVTDWLNSKFKLLVQKELTERLGRRLTCEFVSIENVA
jgi:phage replication O-like protein O